MACVHAPDRTRMPRLQTDTTKMAELEESEEELGDEDLRRYYFYKIFQHKQICICFQRRKSWAANESQHTEKTTKDLWAEEKECTI